MEDINIAVIGLGPHAKRIYMGCFNHLRMTPKLIVDLNTKEKETMKYLQDNEILADTYFVDDNKRDLNELDETDKEKLQEEIKRLKITHAIISTEPKAHLAYIKFFLNEKINVLVDKPLTAPAGINNPSELAQKLKSEYDEVKQIYDSVKNDNVKLQIQCQRRWHKGYKFIYDEISKVVNKYKIPITTINVYHSDGMWNMPDEFLKRENHPYKYGYGKLLHSGYHFIDLIGSFERINDVLIDKKADNVDLMAMDVRPNDFLGMVNNEDYKRIFNVNKFDEIFENEEKYFFDRFGELDVYSVFQFKKQDRVISTATLNLVQNGFSRRAWTELPVDTYKGNGRVRHEYLNIQIGPLMNVQIHSYQSKQIAEKTTNKSDVGEIEHFDIYIFRNTDIIGGKSFEKYSISDFAGEEDIFLGYNEDAREKCFVEFISDRVDENEIYSHELSMKILINEYEALGKRMFGKEPFVNFDI